MDEHSAFVSELGSDRLIEIIVGTSEDRKTYRVQQKLLESVSDFFTRGLREGFKEGKEGRMEFPDDDVAAWEVLLFWIIHHRLPAFPIPIPDEKDVLMMHCWVLGDKYNIPRFQDEAMLVLIRYYHEGESDVETWKIGVANTAPSSKLRKLIAEEVVYATLTEDDESSAQVFAELDGLGFMNELMATQARWIRDKRVDAKVHKRRAIARKNIWKDFMVSDWPLEDAVHPQLDVLDSDNESDDEDYDDSD